MGRAPAGRGGRLTSPPLRAEVLDIIATSNPAGVSGFDDPRFQDDLEVGGSSAQSDLAGEDRARGHMFTSHICVNDSMNVTVRSRLSSHSC